MPVMPPVLSADLALPPPLPAPPEIGFANSLALRVCLLAASITVFISNLLGLLPGDLRAFGSIALLGSSGVLAVFLYLRRGGGPVTVIGGARLGWITGVFCFVILLVLFTIGVLLSDGKSISAVLEQVAAEQQMDGELKRIISDRDSTIAMVSFSMLIVFVTMSMMASVGGALGAKYFGERHSS